MAVAEPADLADLLGITFTPDQEARATRLLELAEGVIAAEVPGIAFDETTDAAVDLPGTVDDLLYLPATPITDVTAVTIDGLDVDPSTYRWDRTGWISRTTPYRSPAINGADPCGWGWSGSTIHVEYEAGPTAGDVGFVALDLVRSVWINPGGLTAETIGQRSATFDTSAGGGMRLTDTHRAVLRRYRPIVTSIRTQVG